MSPAAIIWTGLIISVVAAVPLFLLVRRRSRSRAALFAVLGRAPLAALCVSAGLALLAMVLLLAVHSGEQHSVTLTPDHPDSTHCTFTWPTRTAPSDHTIDCTVGSDPVTREAVRLPGTSTVIIIGSDNTDSLSSTLFELSFFAAVCGGIGLACNAVRFARREDAARQRAFSQWYGAVSRGGRGPGERTWAQIAERSESTRALCRPLMQPEQFTDVSSQAGVLSMSYPYSYLRVVTNAPGGRCAVLLFSGDEAWLLDAAGPLPREGTALVSRVPSAPNDLQMTIDGYTYDIADAPVYLTATALEALRRHCATWLVAASTGTGPQR